MALPMGGECRDNCTRMERVPMALPVGGVCRDYYTHTGRCIRCYEQNLQFFYGLLQAVGNTMQIGFYADLNHCTLSGCDVMPFQGRLWEKCIQYKMDRAYGIGVVSRMP